MSKFKVGDKVQILCNDDSQFDIGTIGIIKSNDGSGHREWEVDFNGTSEWFDGDEIELTTPKLTKNQRITALEKEVAELKVIVHQLRKPSTVVQEAIDKAEWQRGEVENIIEFEGKQYKKVDREAREGDVVILREPAEQTPYVKNDMPYKVVRGYNGKPYLIDSTVAYLYNGHFGRTPETVDVYELIVEDKSKSPNQLRAEIIEKAKGFVKENLKKNHPNACYDKMGAWLVSEGGFITVTTKIDFVVNDNKRTIVALIRCESGEIRGRGIAKCMHDDVFNEHIGKAIALGRALGLDVSEFEQAVNPTEFVKGQLVKYENSELLEVDHVRKNEVSEKAVYFAGVNWMHAYELAIINDTNAIYGGVE